MKLTFFFCASPCHRSLFYFGIMPAKGVPLGKGPRSKVKGKELQVERSSYVEPEHTFKTVDFSSLTCLNGYGTPEEQAWPPVESRIAGPVHPVSTKDAKSLKAVKTTWDNRIPRAIASAIQFNVKPFNLPLSAYYLEWNDKEWIYNFIIQASSMHGLLLFLPAFKRRGCFFAFANYLDRVTEFHRRRSAAYTGILNTDVKTSWQLYVEDKLGPEHDMDLHSRFSPATDTDNAEQRAREKALKEARRKQGLSILSKKAAAEKLFLEFFGEDCFDDPCSEEPLANEANDPDFQATWDENVADREAVHCFRPLRGLSMEYTPGVLLTSEVNGIHRSKTTDTVSQWQTEWDGGSYDRGAERSTFGGMDGEAGWNNATLTENKALKLEVKSLEATVKKLTASLKLTKGDLKIATKAHGEAEFEQNTFHADQIANLEAIHELALADLKAKLTPPAASDTVEPAGAPAPEEPVPASEPEEPATSTEPPATELPKPSKKRKTKGGTLGPKVFILLLIDCSPH